MEAALSDNSSLLNQYDASVLAYALCPSIISKIDSYIPFLFKNVLKFKTSEEVAKYACLQMQIGQVEIPNLSTALAIVRVIGGILGVVGSILALIVFTRPEYKDCVTMIYHRFANGIEIINGLILFHDGIDELCKTYLWQFETWVYVSVKIIICCRGSSLFIINMLVLWISFERITACLANRLFNKLNTRTIAWCAIGVVIIVATVSVMPNGFTDDYYFDNSTSTYKEKDSAFTHTNAFKYYSIYYAVFTLVHVALLIIASVLAVWGFVSMAKRKRKLINVSKGHTCTSSDNELVKQCSANLQLCVLQLCETVPFTINEFLLASYLIHYNYAVDLPLARTAPFEMSFEKAVVVANANKKKALLQFFVHIGLVVSHSLRFYWYILFSAKARNCFLTLVTKTLSKYRSQIEPLDATERPKTSTTRFL